MVVVKEVEMEVLKPSQPSETFSEEVSEGFGRSQSFSGNTGNTGINPGGNSTA